MLSTRFPARRAVLATLLAAGALALAACAPGTGGEQGGEDGAARREAG